MRCRAMRVTAPCWPPRWTTGCSLPGKRPRRTFSPPRMGLGTAASERRKRCCRRSQKPRIWLHKLACAEQFKSPIFPIFVTLQVAMAQEPKERRNWTNDELDLIVADYFAMLNYEAAGYPYSKAQHNRSLQRHVDRTEGSIEFKHQNISAVLFKLGL